MTRDIIKHLVKIYSLGIISDSHQLNVPHSTVLDTLTISGVASELPVTVTVTAKDVWTFTLSSAFSLGAFPPMVLTVTAFRLLA